MSKWNLVYKATCNMRVEFFIATDREDDHFRIDVGIVENGQLIPKHPLKEFEVITHFRKFQGFPDRFGEKIEYAQIAKGFRRMPFGGVEYNRMKSIAEDIEKPTR